MLPDIQISHAVRQIERRAAHEWVPVARGECEYGGKRENQHRKDVPDPRPALDRPLHVKELSQLAEDVHEAEHARVPGQRVFGEVDDQELPGLFG